MHRLVLVTLLAAGGLASAERAEPQQSVAGPRLRPPPRPPVPVVAPEIKQLARELAGDYTCKGVQLKGDGSSTPLVASLSVRLELKDAWIWSALVETKPGITGISWHSYTTYDAIAKQWTRVHMASDSGHVVSTSLGEKAGKWLWEGTEASPSGTLQVRDYEQRDGKDLKVWGEGMMGGSWQKLYEATCKR